MKAVAGITRSTTPGFTRSALTGQYSQLNPRVPEDESGDTSWDNGSGVAQLLQDVERNDDYGTSNQQLLGTDGVAVPSNDVRFSVEAVKQQLHQRQREARLGIDVADDFSDADLTTHSDDGTGKRRMTFRDQLQRLAKPFGNLSSGVESELNYPFHFLNTIVRYYDAGLLGAALMLLLLTSLVGAMWVALLEYTSLKDIFIKHDIPGSLSIVNLIIALVYNTLVQQSLSGFESAPQMYLQTITAVRNLVRSFTTAVEIPKNLQKPRENTTIATGLRENSKPEKNIIAMHHRDVMERCLRSYELCKALLQFSLQLYSSSRDSMRAFYSQEVQDILRECGMRPDNQRTMLPHFMTFLLDIWMEDVTILKNEHLLEPTDITLLQRAEEELRSCMDRFDALRQVHAPDIFNNLLRIVMYFYVLFILPVSMFDSVGQYMIVSYDIVVLLVFGPVYFKWWLGDPFDSSPRYTGMPFHQWRATVLADICLRQSEMRIKWAEARPDFFTEQERGQLIGCNNKLRAMKIATLEHALQDDDL